MKITFLGTSCMFPTIERNHTGILLNYGSENILFDCGENIQRQLRIAKISPTKITKILLTHLHGDHILGLPGLIFTLEASNYTKTLEIYGPKGTKLFFKKMMNLYRLDEIKIKVTEINNKVFLKTREFNLEAYSLKHNIPCLAYSFIENPKRRINLNYMKKFNLTKDPLLGNLQQGKNIVYKGKKIKAKDATYLIPGKKITLILDTIPCTNCIKAAKNSDLLIAEATFSDELKEKARLFKHLTASQSAQIAKSSKSKKLILTHFSQRYKDVKGLEKEAKKIFKNTISAYDFLNIEIA